MRTLLDTQAILYFLEGDSRLSPEARDAIDDASNEKFFSLACFW